MFFFVFSTFFTLFLLYNISYLYKGCVLYGKIIWYLFKRKEERFKQNYTIKKWYFLSRTWERCHLLSNAFGFKLTNLNNEIKKCGFPCSSLDKYLKLFNTYNLSISIIDTERNTNYTLKDFEINRNIQDILGLIKNVNIDNLSIIEAYNFIENLQKKIKDII